MKMQPQFLKPKNKFEATCKVSLGVGLIGATTSIIGWIFDIDSFFKAWLFAWFYWFSIAMGCLGFFMIYRLTGGEWGKSFERVLLSAAKTIEILAILFLPVFAGVKHLYNWSHVEVVRSDPQLLHKNAYLNIPFWCARTLFYFIGLYLLTWILVRANQESAKRWSAGGFIFIFIIISFASIDWIMSLEPHWYSTVYGMIIISGQGICGIAFPLLIIYYLHKLPHWGPPLTDKVLKDYGNLQLTTCVLWTYVAFVQWLIIWIGNVPETVKWYTSRANGSWGILAWVIVITQFGIPFQLLLFQRFKTKPRNLAGLGFLLLIAHWLDLYWIIVPAFHPDTFAFNWMSIPTTVAIGGLWISYFLKQLQTIEPMSVGNEYTRRLKEALNHD